MTMTLDEKDEASKNEIVATRSLINIPIVGDYVLFPTGELERLSYDWGDSFQTSSSGSFYLSQCGSGDCSGAMNPAVSTASLSLTEMTLPGSFWFFHHNRSGAGRGVHFDIPCRLYETNAPYKGFSNEFQTSQITMLQKRLAETAQSPANGT